MSGPIFVNTFFEERVKDLIAGAWVGLITPEIESGLPEPLLDRLGQVRAQD